MQPAVSPLSARRGALAQYAAQCALAQRPAGPLLPKLCRLSTAELLAGSGTPGPAIDLGGELAALCAAMEQAVRRRSGWLSAALGPAPPVRVPQRLLQAAVLCIVGSAVRHGTPAAVSCMRHGDAALLLVRGGRPRPEEAALPGHLAARGRGLLLTTARPPFTAVWRLPPAGAVPTKAACYAEDLLADRYSLLYQYLAGHCAGPGL